MSPAPGCVPRRNRLLLDADTTTISEEVPESQVSWDARLEELQVVTTDEMTRPGQGCTSNANNVPPACTLLPLNSITFTRVISTTQEHHLTG